MSWRELSSPWEGVDAKAFAGLGRRFVAFVVDLLILSVVSGLLSLLTNRSTEELVGFVVSLVYFTSFEGQAAGATPGKRLMRIRVVDVATAGPIGYPRALVRRLGHIISTLVILLGFLWMLWDPRRQCWHDKMADDVVVPISTQPAPA